MSVKIFNPAALTDLIDLETEDEPNLVFDLISIFIATYPEIFSNLQTFSDARDLANLEIAAHSLKSSANVLGLEQVGKSCAEIETLARDKTMSVEKLPLLEKQLAAAHGELARYLTSRNLELKSTPSD